MILELDNPMTETFTIERTLIQSMGAFAGFQQAKQMVWEEYQAWAVPRIEEAAFILRGQIAHIPTFTPDNAQRDLAFIKTISAPMTTFQQQIETVNDPSFMRIQQAASLLFQALLDVKQELTKAAAQKDNVRASFHYMGRHRQNPRFSKYIDRNAQST